MKTATWTSALAVLGASTALASPLKTRNNDGSSCSGNPPPQPVNYGAGYDTSNNTYLPNANCYTASYNIALTSTNMIFNNVNSYANSTELFQITRTFITTMPFGGMNFTEEYLTGGATQQVTGNYSISGTLCTPYDTKGKDPNNIQLLVHGIGFDSSYWNFGYAQQYSYAYAAADAGYTTFRYDRLGTGLSEKPQDAYNTVQAQNDVDILTIIIQGLKQGWLVGKSFNNVSGVGHSFGSIQLQAVTQTNPDLLNAVVLTGFSANTTAAPYYLASAAYNTATDVFPNRFSTDELSRAYVATSTPNTDYFGFFWNEAFENGAIEYARATEQPVTQGVLFTFGALTKPAMNYTGKVHIVTGDHDFIFCFSNCYAVPPGSSVPSIPAGSKMLFPAVAAADFSTYIPAETGHAVNIHLSAPQTYQEILSFFDTV